MKKTGCFRNDLHLLNAEQIAEEIRNLDYWDADLCERLCELAGLEQEWCDAQDWNETTGETFELTIEKAAKRLQVAIY